MGLLRSQPGGTCFTVRFIMPWLRLHTRARNCPMRREGREPRWTLGRPFGGGKERQAACISPSPSPGLRCLECQKKGGRSLPQTGHPLHLRSHFLLHATTALSRGRGSPNPVPLEVTRGPVSRGSAKGERGAKENPTPTPLVPLLGSCLSPPRKIEINSAVVNAMI